MRVLTAVLIRVAQYLVTQLFIQMARLSKDPDQNPELHADGHNGMA